MDAETIKTIKRAKASNRRESEVLREVLRMLKAFGMWHMRINTGGMYDKRGQFVRFAAPGCADILASENGRFLWIECKREGGRLSRDQVLFERAVRQQSHSYLIVRSASELAEYLTRGSE